MSKDEMRQVHRPIFTAHPVCERCVCPWPCDAAQLLDENEALRAALGIVLDECARTIHHFQTQSKGGQHVGFVPRMNYSLALAFVRDIKHIAGMDLEALGDAS